MLDSSGRKGAGMNQVTTIDRQRTRLALRDVADVPPWCAVLGGTETFAPTVAQPYAALVQQATGQRVANYGCLNSGPDAYLGDPVMALAEAARMSVVQIADAQNVTNPFYGVHPRRNDRVTAPSALLRQLFPEVDFTEVHFTRHLMEVLRDTSEERFDVVVAGVQGAWMARMSALLARLPAPVLLWMSDHRPGTGAWGAAPLLVSRAMVTALAANAWQYVEVVAPTDRLHRSVADALVPLVERAPEGAPPVTVSRSVPAQG